MISKFQRSWRQFRDVTVIWNFQTSLDTTICGPARLSFRRSFTPNQGWINLWANRANARGLALAHQNTPLLVFHVFRLFTTRRNCKAFWLLPLVYGLRKLTTLACIVFEWLNRIEPKSTTLYYPRISSKSMHPWRSAESFPAGATSKFCLSLSGCWRSNANWRSQNSLPFL